MKKIAYDSIKLDQMKIVEDSKCCLKVDAVITKEGVYQYPDGRAFKSRIELLKAANAIKYAGAKITIYDHPDSMVVMSQNQIFGGLEPGHTYFDRNKIRARLNFDKSVTPKKFLNKVRNAVLKNLGMDVSIGFYYAPDFTPGLWRNPINHKNEPYDYVMRDILIDHVATGVLKGRCSFPDCGIGVDTMMRRISKSLIQLDKVVKRGNKWCVVHCHPDGSIGKTIKCFATKQQAEAMHRAIQAQKHGSAFYGNVNKLSTYEVYFAGVDQDKRPPKAWWDNCVSKAQGFADDPARFCGWLWHSGDEPMKSSFGRSSIKGGKKRMSQAQLDPATKEEFEECVRQTMESEGMTREQAEAHCLPPTEPEEEPTPFEALDQEELSPYQKCIRDKMEAGATMEEATEKCKEEGITKGDQDAAFDNCVERKMEEGMSREEAEKECRAEHPVAAEDQEPTPMERCIENRMEATEDTEEEARKWCEAELAGEHAPAQDMIARSEKLLKLREQHTIEERRQMARQRRRRPL